ncbi:MAG: hypothetical protein AB1716_13385 [Planctomycetota bacterium]
MSVGGDANDVTVEIPLAGRLIIGGSLLGDLQVTQDVAGAAGQPAIDIGGDLDGEIQVYWSLCDDPNAAVEIRVGDPTADPNQVMGASSAIAIVWVGYADPNAPPYSELQWEPNAIIQVGDTEFGGNSPADRVYRVSCLKGDLNNDDLVDFNDITPFYLSITNYGSGYFSAYPGLWGSRAYHTDCSCDGWVDPNHTNAFVLRMTDPDAWYVNYRCEHCPGGNGLGMPGLPPVPRIPPEVLAADLAANVSRALFPELVRSAAYTAEHDPNPIVRTYWRAVHAALAP